MLNFENPMWIAQRERQDWRDDDSLAAIDWLASTVAEGEWRRRVDTTEARFQTAKDEWAQGHRVPLFDPNDFDRLVRQSSASIRRSGCQIRFLEPEGYRIAPIFRRLGQLLPELKAIQGADERAARLMAKVDRSPTTASTSFWWRPRTRSEAGTVSRSYRKCRVCRSSQISSSIGGRPAGRSSASGQEGQVTLETRGLLANGWPC